MSLVVLPHPTMLAQSTLCLDSDALGGKNASEANALQLDSHMTLNTGWKVGT